jgi:hypothetical protein
MDILEVRPGLGRVGTGGAEQLTGSDRIMLGLAALGLLSTALLGNPRPPARPWPADSILQYIVWAVSFGYQLGTLHGVEVKTTLVSLIGGILLVWATVRVLRGRLRLLPDVPSGEGTGDERASAATLSLFAVLLLVAWSLASVFWSRDAATAVGGTWVLSLGWVWAAALALHGHRRLVRPMIDVMLAAASVTAALSLWYWHSRAIEERLGWPLGNPLSLGSVMLPAVLIGAGRLAEQVSGLWGRLPDAAGAAERMQGPTGLPWQPVQETAQARASPVDGAGMNRRWPATAGALVYAAVTGLALATLLATGSRGPLLALLIGLVAGVWVAAARPWRVALSLGAVVVVALAAPMAANWLFHAGGGRDASARMRVYAWRDALRLAASKPAAGHGAGAYALLSTGMSLPDCVLDPLAMSGEISTDAHSEPLQLLAELGVFGAVIGLAIWGFAGAAAIGRAQGADRWLAAGVSGAIAAAFVDASTGVSWRLVGPGPFLAMPVALAWMLCRASPTAQGTARRGPAGWGLIPAAAGIAVGLAGIVDFAAARCLFRAQSAMQQVERALVADGIGPSTRQAGEVRKRAAELAGSALAQADTAARWRMDPSRRLVCLLAAARLRASLGYMPLLLGASPEDLAAGQRIMDAGIGILQRLETIAPGYADAGWRMAELLDDKASLAGKAGDEAGAARDRQRALEAALGYLGIRPLDRERIWQSFSIWPEIPPAQRLSLLRGVLREEAEVWRQLAPATAAYIRWARQRGYAARMWQQLGEQADSVDDSFMETGYSSLRLAYRQWRDPLAPEAVRLSAIRRVVRGEPAQAADALELANLLYERTGGLLPYSQAVCRVELAACRIRQGTDQSAWAAAAIAQARQILAPLPQSAVRAELEALADQTQRGIEAAGGGYAGSEPEPWLVAVDLFWDMPPGKWPADIEAWARRADAASAAKGGPANLTLQLLVGRGDAKAAWAQMEQMLAQGAARTAVEGALREAAFRWPARQAMAAALIQQLRSASSPASQ